MKAWPMQEPIIRTIEDKVDQIRRGEELLRDEFIHDYQPLIKKIVSKVCRRYVDCTMDEYSIGLFAFNEAINQFQGNRGGSFLAFADLVIRRRVIDFIRKDAKQKQLFILAPEENDEADRLGENLPQLTAAIHHFEVECQREELAYEIDQYRKILWDYDITFEKVRMNCPIRDDARQRAKMIAKVIVEDENLSLYLQYKKKLPLLELLMRVSCSRKTIERHRSYIIAVTLIYLEPFNELRPYIGCYRKL